MQEYLTVKVIKTKACFDEGSESFKIDNKHLDAIIHTMGRLELISKIGKVAKEQVYQVSSLTKKKG